MNGVGLKKPGWWIVSPWIVSPFFVVVVVSGNEKIKARFSYFVDYAIGCPTPVQSIVPCGH